MGSKKYHWSDGVIEYWSIAEKWTTPLQYSNTPLLLLGYLLRSLKSVKYTNGFSR